MLVLRHISNISEGRRKPKHHLRLGLCSHFALSAGLYFSFLILLLLFAFCLLRVSPLAPAVALWAWKWRSSENWYFKRLDVGRICPCSPGSVCGWWEHIVLGTNVVVRKGGCHIFSHFVLFWALCLMFWSDLVLETVSSEYLSGATAVPAAFSRLELCPLESVTDPSWNCSTHCDSLWRLCTAEGEGKEWHLKQKPYLKPCKV